MNAATFLMLHQVSTARRRTTGYGSAYAGKATTVGGAGTDPENDNKFAVVFVALATCAALGCCVMMSLFLKPIL